MKLLHQTVDVQYPASDAIDALYKYLRARNGRLVLRVPLRPSRRPPDPKVTVEVRATYGKAADTEGDLRFRHSLAFEFSPKVLGSLAAIRGVVTARPQNTGCRLKITVAYEPMFGWIGSVTDGAVGRRYVAAAIDELLNDFKLHLEMDALESAERDAFDQFLANVRSDPTLATGSDLPSMSTGKLSIRRHGAYIACVLVLEGLDPDSAVESGEYTLEPSVAKELLRGVLGQPHAPAATATPIETGHLEALAH